MAKLNIKDFDNPATFILAVVLVILPILALVAALLAKYGLPSPLALAGGTAAA